jgi:hypothetical protein
MTAGRVKSAEAAAEPGQACSAGQSTSRTSPRFRRRIAHIPRVVLPIGQRRRVRYRCHGCHLRARGFASMRRAASAGFFLWFCGEW